jgi:hypothetical protein
MGKHSQDNDDDGYWPKPVPKDERDGGGQQGIDQQNQDDDGREEEN